MARQREALPPVVFKDGEHGAVPAGISSATMSALTGHFGESFRFFAMQSAVISHLLHAGRIQQPGDVILRSPTGSGKTLAYVIPIIERLATRSIPRLRAVIIVPTHDLAVQVHSIFQLFSTNISVVLATGATRDENVREAEVLIATPGTLLDHVENTPGVSLAYVEFLVLDESDRLLADAFYDWADVVLPRCGMMQDENEDKYRKNDIRNKIGPCSGVLALGIPATATGNLHASRRIVLTRKILVSATATRDPQRIAKLDLRRISYFEPYSNISGNEESRYNSDNYAVPSGLSECAYVLDSAQQKPMALLSILGWNPTETPDTFVSPLAMEGSKLIFTKSVESAHRLSRLLELFAWKQSVAPIVVEISRHVTPERRENILALLRGNENGNSKGRPVVVVCSDVFARGIDIPSVEAIINYDVPPRIRNYLHRVGRTARAGRSGIAVTLLLKTQVRHFKVMVKDLDRQGGGDDGGNRKCKIRDKSLDTLQKVQQVAILANQLNAVKRILRRESLGLVVPGECLPSHILAEMDVDYESIMKEVAEKRNSNNNNVGNGVPPTKRVRVNDEERDDAMVDEKERGVEEGSDDIDSGAEDDMMGVEDSFQDLITAHVAYNWTRSRGEETPV